MLFFSLSSFIPSYDSSLCFVWRFVLRAHPRALPLPHFSFGAKHLSHRHTPLCKTRFVYLCSSSLHSILWCRSVCGFAVWKYVILHSLKISLYKCFFFLLVEPSLVFNRFFQSCRRSVACLPGISVLDVQVLETSNVVAYINFCCVVLEILCFV